MLSVIDTINKVVKQSSLDGGGGTRVLAAIASTIILSIPRLVRTNIVELHLYLLSNLIPPSCRWLSLLLLILFPVIILLTYCLMLITKHCCNVAWEVKSNLSVFDGKNDSIIVCLSCMSLEGVKKIEVIRHRTIGKCLGGYGVSQSLLRNTTKLISLLNVRM